MINSNKLMMISALSAGLLWVICSILVALLPHYMLEMTGHIIHIDMVDLSWTLTWFGFFVGLLSWVSLAGITAAILAVIYNRLVGFDIC